MPSKKVSWADKVKFSIPKKPSSNIVFNLKDVDKEQVFILDIPPSILSYSKYDKRCSMYLVENAQYIIGLNNYYNALKN